MLAHASLVLALGACGTRTTATPEPGEPPGAPNEIADYHLIPVPELVNARPGSFSIVATTVVAASDPSDDELRALSLYAAALIAERSGVSVTVSQRRANGAEEGRILLMLANEEEAHPEGYRLEVEANRIVVSASTHAGLFYGVQTLQQLVPAGHGSQSVSVPAVEVVDKPRFGYRGMHLDVGRHFFPVSFVKKYIDLLAMYKMNTFHWHLTEDQGWRIEIKKYPRLTEIGAFRKETLLARNFDPYVGDKKPYGGYYTQDEIREVVAYARSRYVTVIPEIEMPGHSLAALAAYPELACTEGPFEVATVWGVHEDIYCPKEETFAFLEDVLAEVMDLFPSRYIHIGGDEAPKARWEESELAHQVMRREGLADADELQSYFVKRIENYLLEHGRRLIGWDEILEGGLAPQATVMSWRGTTGGIEAAEQGHDVIMTPTSHMYFDYYQGEPAGEPLAIGGFLPLEKVYEFEPVPEVLSQDEAKHVLGAQGNVWTEYMKTTQYVEYMVFPRMLALAEVLWSPKQARDWGRFTSDLAAHFDILDAYQVNYRVPTVNGLERDMITLSDKATISLATLIPGSHIRYTTDGSAPTAGSTLYTGAFELPVDTAGVEVTARAFLASGKGSNPRSAHFARTTLRAADEFVAEEMRPGLRYSYYEARVESVKELVDGTPEREGVAEMIGLEMFDTEEPFGLDLHGHIRVPASGVYTFYLTSDDGSELRVASEIVIDHDGLHGATERSGMIALEAGYHPIEIRYFQAGGGKQLDLRVQLEGEQRQAIGAGWLFHRAVVD
jgi:hexosaminidase